MSHDCYTFYLMYLSFNVNNHHTNYSCPWYNSNGRELYVLQPTTTTDNTENEQKEYQILKWDI